MTAGPRIYNLFPLLAGAVRDWPEHLPRVAGMGFDWIHLNPFHEPGGFGSLYAVKDHYRLHPLVAGADEREPAAVLRDFTQAAGRRGLSVMMELAAGFVARDSRLAERHPHWFVREADGALRPPRSGDPLDPRRVTVWEDLAELDYCRTSRRGELADYWAEVVHYYLGAGLRGFCCKAAHTVPASLWRYVIDGTLERVPDCLFCAEALGATPQQAAELGEAGFHYVFNSVAWWDLREDWLLEECERLRRVAPTVGFPESHETGRLAERLRGADPAQLEARYRQRYLLACAVSTGVMMPMGYEYGFARPLDPVDTRPGDWAWQVEQAPFDLGRFVAGANAAKAELAPLDAEGPQRRVTAPNAPVVGLLRLGGPTPLRSKEAAVTLFNPDDEGTHAVEVGTLLAEAGGLITELADATPLAEPLALQAGERVTLRPLDVRLLYGTALPLAARTQPPSRRESERRLCTLAEQRISIENVYPAIDGGRHAVKRVVGDVLEVSADIFGDGHEKIAARVRYRAQGERRWRESRMTHVDNDRWAGRIPLGRNSRYVFTIEAWRDPFESWRAEFGKKHDAGQRISLELVEGRRLVEQAAAKARGRDRRALAAALERLQGAGEDEGLQIAELLSAPLRELMSRAGERRNSSRYHRELEVVVDRGAARFAAWYELFPRSQSDDPSRHGTFDDVIAKLPYVRDMGFDVLYFPPVHPIGRTHRKGRNNSLVAGPEDPGSPYAIGSEEGGHTAVHPALGTLADFRRLVDAAHDHGLEIALDFAIQCSRDHPWIKQHPEWFDWRPDGSIKFAENPPKTYEDIVNVHLYREALPSIWYELRDVVLFWVEQGVKIFRVDNPHTKPFPFWEWLIRDIQERDPEVIFLSEAFTRPKVMLRLAKLGFTQSYTYFTWRTEKQELIDYLTELTGSEAREYFRPNFFTNTPDINPRILQTGGRPAFLTRVTLAATLSGLYGIYSGFELCEATPVPGKEEYLNSEKYEIKAWDWDRPGHIRDYIASLNRIRRDNPALHDHLNLRFYNAWDDHILVYGKMTAARDNLVLVAVNLDPHAPHGAHFEVPLWELGLPDAAQVEAEDLLAGHRFTWHGKVQHVWLDPQVNPTAIWRILPPGLPA